MEHHSITVLTISAIDNFTHLLSSLTAFYDMNVLCVFQAGGARYPPKPYIVDLIHEPGKLLPVNTPEAVSYQKL